MWSVVYPHTCPEAFIASCNHLVKDITHWRGNLTKKNYSYKKKYSFLVIMFYRILPILYIRSSKIENYFTYPLNCTLRPIVHCTVFCRMTDFELNQLENQISLGKPQKMVLFHWPWHWHEGGWRALLARPLNFFVASLRAIKKFRMWTEIWDCVRAPKCKKDE